MRVLPPLIATKLYMTLYGCQNPVAYSRLARQAEVKARPVPGRPAPGVRRCQALAAFHRNMWPIAVGYTPVTVFWVALR